MKDETNEKRRKNKMYEIICVLDAWLVRDVCFDVSCADALSMGDKFCTKYQAYNKYNIS